MSKNEIAAVAEAALGGLAEQDTSYSEGFKDAVAIISAILGDDA